MIALPKGSIKNVESLWKAAVTGNLIYLRFLVKIWGLIQRLKSIMDVLYLMLLWVDSYQLFDI